MKPVCSSFLQWFAEHRADLDALVLDIDGVLMVNGRLLQGTREFVAYLREQNVTFTILTNSADLSVEERCTGFKSAGLIIYPEEITSSAHSLKGLVVDRNLENALFFVIGSLGSPCYAESSGLKVTRSVEDLSSCGGIILGEGNYNWEIIINEVINFLIQFPKVPFIVPNPDIYFPIGKDSIRIGSGGISRLIVNTLKSYGVEVEVIYLGKPYRPIFTYNHLRLEERARSVVDPGRVMMVGDTITGDVKGAKSFGYRTALTLTGATSMEYLCSSDIQPDLVVKGI